MPRLIMIDSGGNDAFTKILLHCDGDDLGLSFPDVAAGAANSHSWSNGVAAGYSDLVYTDATNPKFGTSPLFFPNSTGGSFLKCADDSDFTLGSNDLTIDMWINRGGDTSNRGLFGQLHSDGLTSGSTIGLLQASGTIIWNLGVGAAVGSITTVTSINDSSWHHIEFVRSGSSMFGFVDGALDVTGTATGSVGDGTTDWVIGRAGDWTSSGTWANFKGRIDEFRLSVGIARRTAAFTPPTIAYF